MTDGAKHLAAMALLAAVGVAVYLPSLDGPFIYDDHLNLVGNEALTDLSNVRQVLSSGYQETRPLTLLSFALCFELGGSPQMFRVVNLSLHLLVVLLVYALGLCLRRDLFRDEPNRSVRRWLPLAAALLFAVHPLAVEAVAYINARAGLLAALFGLGSVLLYLNFDQPRSRPARVGFYAASLLCLLLAVLSKESAAVTPILAGLYLRLLRRRRWRALLPLLPLLIVGVALSLSLLALARYPHGQTFGLALMPWGPYLLTQLRVLVLALTLPFFPLDLSLDYDFRLSQSPLGPEVLVAAAVLAALLSLVWRYRRAQPVLAFVLSWYLIALAPTNSIVQFKDFLAERHLYLSLVAFAVLVPWVLLRWGDHLRRRSSPLAAAPLLCSLVLIVSFALLATSRAALFANPVALWTQTAQASPRKARPLVNLGIALAQRGQHAAARRALQRALQRESRSHDAWYNLGVSFERGGDLLQAVRCFRRATKLGPRRAYQKSLSRAANRYGVAQFGAGDLTAAAAAFREAADADPTAAGPRFNLAMVLMRSGGSPQQVARLLRRALQIDPSHSKARFWLKKLESL